MIKNLTKHGNSHALIIDRSLMEQTGITPDSALQVTVNGDGIHISLANVGVGTERVREIMDGLQPRYGKTLRRLAQ